MVGYTTVPLGELAWFWEDNKPWKKENKKKEICIWEKRKKMEGKEKDFTKCSGRGGNALLLVHGTEI